ncbi:unnamed protein product [Bursaphelenchus xylophilus]|uniref:(pine wood nematode) hypothetical protein n=1 Tax=Bursaphelenchus xylophilus TaxID=6326 RepID=A0A1I7SVK6_BURXY|nr:unnamed protein product [Bursaphelenchus xylophilus]CAG9101597.1 unnamed protein product [Bursaphelenchus xylophilus]
MKLIHAFFRIGRLLDSPFFEAHVKMNIGPALFPLIFCLFPLVQGQDEISRLNDVLKEFEMEYLDQWEFLNHSLNFCRRNTQKSNTPLNDLEEGKISFCDYMDVQRNQTCKNLQVESCRRFSRKLLLDYAFQYLEAMNTSSYALTDICLTGENSINPQLFDELDKLVIGDIPLSLYVNDTQTFEKDVIVIPSKEVHLLARPDAFCRNFNVNVQLEDIRNNEIE